jgi:hypothetical protein
MLTAEQQRIIRTCKIALLFVTGSRPGLATLDMIVQKVIECPELSSLVLSPTDVSCFNRPPECSEVPRTQQELRTPFEKPGFWPSRIKRSTGLPTVFSEAHSAMETLLN